MNKINKFFKTSFDKKIDGTGLAIFRIAYCLVLLCEISQLMYFRSLIFDKIPFIRPAEIDFAIPISIWFICVLFLLFGTFTRFFSILNYLVGLILVGSMHSFEYHVFYAYMSINFLLIFIPISQCFSIDRLFQKLKYSNTTFQYNPTKKVSQLYYFILPLVGIGFVYFDSIFFKLSSNVWMNGLGSWLPSSLPMMTNFNHDEWFLNQEGLVKFVGWFTILFEASFLFLFFRKRWRLCIFVVGMILHLGILLEFPIVFFALTVNVLYLLLIPVSFWNKIFSIDKDYSTLIFYYDSECPLCIRTKIIINHLDWFNKINFKTVQFDSQDSQYLKHIATKSLLDDIYSVDSKGIVYFGVDTYIQVMKRIFYLYPLALILRIPGIYQISKKCYNFIAKNRTTERCTEENCGYNPPSIPDDSKIKILQYLTLEGLKYRLIVFSVLLMSFIQFTFLYNTPYIIRVKEKIGLKGTSTDKLISGTIDFYKNNLTQTFFGLTNHPVFVDEHFKNYNHIIAIVYIDKKNKEQWLPIIDKNGQPDYYIHGANWVKWTFRVNSPLINQNILNRGIKRFTAFWAYKNNIDLTDAKFLVKVKKNDSLKKWEWEKDYFNKQLAKPWLEGGYVEWKNRVFISDVKNIERL
ncbi:hypothetical protein OA88_03340 [Flavobacterium sp. JRM]|nr:hypothetical protein OA88_03340 [Flavobacterium sp. JRM]